jgi:hypothetical protein
VTWSFRDRVLWLAGLLDGEGSFGAPARHGMKIQLRMSDRDTVERAASFLGVGPASIRTEVRSARWKTMYRFDVCGPGAAGWMMMLYPFLSGRRQERVRAVLAYWRGLQPGARWRQACPHDHPYVPTLRRGRRVRRCLICERERARIRKHRTDLRTASLFKENLAPLPARIAQ